MNSVSIPSRPACAAREAAAAMSAEVASRYPDMSATDPIQDRSAIGRSPRPAKPTPVVGFSADDLLLQSRVRRAPDDRAGSTGARASDQLEGDRRRRGAAAGLSGAGGGTAAQGRSGVQRAWRAWWLLAVATGRGDRDGRGRPGAGGGDRADGVLRL